MVQYLKFVKDWYIYFLSPKYFWNKNINGFSCVHEDVS